MANHPITIQGIDPASNDLILSDRGRTTARPGDTVTWIIDPQSGVASITDIAEKPGSPDVFNPDPAPLGGSPNWQGTIRPTDTPTEEEYNISYTKASGGGVFVYDPIIQVNP
jgi:hypothetical protein